MRPDEYPCTTVQARQTDLYNLSSFEPRLINKLHASFSTSNLLLHSLLIFLSTIIKETMSDKQKSIELKRDFETEANRCFEYAESLEDLLNAKIKAQEADPQNMDHLKDLQKANVLLAMVVNLLADKS